MDASLRRDRIVGGETSVARAAMAARAVFMLN
jgi:hypothetical protein